MTADSHIFIIYTVPLFIAYTLQVQVNYIVAILAKSTPFMLAQFLSIIENNYRNYSRML